jgi:toxin ParE1/3/4
MKIRYNALARADVVDILKYYEREAGHQTAVDFFAELSLAIKRIAATPFAFHEVKQGIRRCLLRRFPYQINYEVVAPSTIKILVVKHQQRDPDFGLDR